MPAIILEEPPRVTYPARFDQLDTGIEFETDAAPGLKFRKSVNGRGECLNKPKRSQFFHAGAPVKPINWTPPERNLDEDFEDGDSDDDSGVNDSGELAAPIGTKAAKAKANPGQAGSGGQRTPPKNTATGAAGSGGQTTVDSDI